MKASKIIIPVLMAGALLGGTIIATDVNARGHKGCPYMMSAESNLTDAQRTALQTLTEESQKKITPLKDALFVKEQELRALQKAPTPDVEAVGKKAAEITKLRGQIREERKIFGEGVDKTLGLPPGTHAFGKRSVCGFEHGHGRPGHGSDNRPEPRPMGKDE